MPGFNQSQGIPGFTVRQGIPFQVPLSMAIQQTISLMLGYTYGEAVVLRSSPSGILYVAEPRLADVYHVTAVGNNYPYQADYKQCTQVMCIGHPSNVALVWVRTRAAATVNNAVPLAANQSITFSVENLSELFALIVADTEKLIVAYSL